MKNTNTLHLYEEIALLALRNREGTAVNSYFEYAVAAAVLAELLLDRRIAIEATKKKLVDLNNMQPVGDPVIDECLEKMQASRKRASLTTWVSKFVAIRKLRHKAALQLCNRGILRAEEKKILLIFTRKIYPEINPLPEKRIVERLRAAIFQDTGEIDPRTAVLVSVANCTKLLQATFGRKEIRQRKQRIKQLSSADLAGEAAKAAIEAIEAAVAIAAAAAAAAAASG